VTAVAAELAARRGDFALDVALDVPEGGVTCLFGPSGAGKTTVLRCLAGLLRPDRGRVHAGGECWQDDARGVFVPPHRRRVGYVFQEPALLPHLTVSGNLRFAERRVPASERRMAAGEAARRLGLGGLLDRRPRELSGGQGQRAAIARALLAAPRLLLMDEPVTSLDLAAREEILDYVRRLQQDLALPVVFVSHAPAEVARVGDHLVWLRDGRVRAAGPVAELLGRIDVAGELGDEAVGVVSATVRDHDAQHHLTALESPWGVLFVRRLEADAGHAVRVRVLASDVSLSLEAGPVTSILNVLSLSVLELAEPRPGEVLVRLGGPPASPAEALVARITARSRDALGLRPGLPVFARVKSVRLLPGAGTA